MEIMHTFKGLGMIDRVPEELWLEVNNIVQKAGTETISKEKNCERTKWLSEEALQIAEKRREVKGKGERERYAQRNAEFQKISKRYKKTS